MLALKLPLLPVGTDFRHIEADVLPKGIKKKSHLIRLGMSFEQWKAPYAGREWWDTVG